MTCKNCDELRAKVAELEEKNEELNVACENYAHVLATEPFKIRADALAAQLERMGELVEKVAEQQAMPDDSWIAERDAILNESEAGK